MTTDAHTEPLTDGVAQFDSAAPSAEAAATTTPAPAAPPVPDYTAPGYTAPGYTAPAAPTAPPAYTAAPAYTAQTQTVTSAPTGYAVPPQGQQYAVPPQAQEYRAHQQQLAPGKNAYGFAIASFVIGIASIISGWTFVAPIVGLVLGALALRRNTTERTLALWGVWLNGAILALAVLGLVALLGLASFGVFAGSLSGWAA